ncbi:unnamed protein product [Lactuca saligna]|uniref:Uncharacterized protein n=1 Tax=Lactuca saligna TaxID=75948 RepID=A0AA35ZNX0_LACSI|nr:unnamed protein product [Lactuca saligna]
MLSQLKSEHCTLAIARISTVAAGLVIIARLAINRSTPLHRSCKGDPIKVKEEELEQYPRDTAVRLVPPLTKFDSRWKVPDNNVIRDVKGLSWKHEYADVDAARAHNVTRRRSRLSKN